MAIILLSTAPQTQNPPLGRVTNTEAADQRLRRKSEAQVLAGDVGVSANFAEQYRSLRRIHRQVLANQRETKN